MKTRAERPSRHRKGLEVPPDPRELDLIVSGAWECEQPRSATRSVPETCLEGSLVSGKELCSESGKEGSKGQIHEAGAATLSPETPKTSV